MKELRQQAAKQYVNAIDHKDLIVIDSSQIEGAKTILKYI